jgi:hypothetical protein
MKILDMFASPEGLENIVERAEEAEGRQEWGNAAKLYERAMDIASTLGAEVDALYCEGKMYENRVNTSYLP